MEMWRLIYLFVAYSGGLLMSDVLRPGEVEFVQLFPLRVSHAAEQSIPPHVHLFLRNTVFFFCGQSVKCEVRKRDCDVIPVRTKDFQDKIQEVKLKSV